MSGAPTLCGGSVRTTMKIDLRTFRRAVVVGAALLAAAACGEVGSDTSPAAADVVVDTSSSERADLAGVRFDVRRDPG